MLKLSIFQKLGIYLKRRLDREHTKGNRETIYQQLMREHEIIIFENMFS